MNTLITGAASGIGRAVARLLVDRAAADPGLLPQTGLFLVDRDAKGLADVEAELRARGATVASMAADLADPATSERIVASAAAALSTLDGLVSNAGIIGGGSLIDMTVEEFDRQFAVNTRPLWLLGKAAHPHLARSRGAIVGTASMSAEHPTPALGAYAASKAAALMLMRQMAIEWGPDGIRCNCVSPGPTLTGLTRAGYADPARVEQRERSIPLRRLGQPTDIASGIVFLLGRDSGFVNGLNLVIDGGMSQMLMPATGSGTGQRAS